MHSFLVILLLFFAVQASPLLIAPRANLDVFDPTIISPISSTIWTIGQTETVLWRTDNAPKEISNGAAIVLQCLAIIDCDLITLAQGFSLLAGEQSVVVPSDISPGLYRIILFGDSGNDSQDFYIVGPEI